MISKIALAHTLVQAHFPDARAAYLGGSYACGTPTDSSDLDIVVVVDSPPAPFRSATREGGTLVEWFVHTKESLWEFAQMDRDEGRCPLCHIVANGMIILGPDAIELKTAAQAWIQAGPQPWDEKTLAYRRYWLGWLKAKGYARVGLHVMPGNVASKRVAGKVGFEHIWLELDADERLGDLVDVEYWERPC